MRGAIACLILRQLADFNEVSRRVSARPIDSRLGKTLLAKSGGGDQTAKIPEAKSARPPQNMVWRVQEVRRWKSECVLPCTKIYGAAPTLARARPEIWIPPPNKCTTHAFR